MKGSLDVLMNGFMLGLTTGPFCLTSCLPVLLSISLGERSSANTAWTFLGKFLGGRFLAYLGLGLLPGLLGNALGGLGHSIGIYGLILLSLIMILYGLGLKLPHAGLCQLAGGGRFFPFVLGGLSGLNICPPLLLAFAYALQREMNVAVGIGYFISFFVATSLFILPVGIVGYLPKPQVIVRIGRYAAIAVGVIFLYRGVSILMVT